MIQQTGEDVDALQEAYDGNFDSFAEVITDIQEHVQERATREELRTLQDKHDKVRIDPSVPVCKNTTRWLFLCTQCSTAACKAMYGMLFGMCAGMCAGMCTLCRHV